jgi:hypothetical protein
MWFLIYQIEVSTRRSISNQMKISYTNSCMNSYLKLRSYMLQPKFNKKKTMIVLVFLTCYEIPIHNSRNIVWETLY